MLFKRYQTRRIINEPSSGSAGVWGPTNRSFRNLEAFTFSPLLHPLTTTTGRRELEKINTTKSAVRTTYECLVCLPKLCTLRPGHSKRRALHRNCVVCGERRTPQNERKNRRKSCSVQRITQFLSQRQNLITGADGSKVFLRF